MDGAYAYSHDNGRYDSGGRWDGESTVERRMLCFSGSENPDDVMEIKVYRAKGRQRVEPELLDYKDVMPTKQVDTPRSRFNGANGIRQVFSYLIGDNNDDRQKPCQSGIPDKRTSKALLQLRSN